MIETFKILTGNSNIQPSRFFKKDEDERTRGHSLKLKKFRSKHHARASFFSNRVVSRWNGLPENVVSATSTNEFKNRLDQYWTVKRPFLHAIHYVPIPY